MAESTYDKFRKLLAELFMFDRADLDFGIYRIMNAKRDEVTRFLDNDLLPQVKESLLEVDTGQRLALQKQLDEVEQACGVAGIDPDTSQKVADLRSAIKATGDPDALEAEVFSHLYSFFRRYYKDGDFISLRRYKEGVYAIPYEGEEVKLYWANHDQYYIKSGEYFRDYTFTLADGRRAHFKLVQADEERDNVKAAAGQERRFLLSSTEPIREQQADDGVTELVIPFEYKPDPQKRKREEVIAEAAEKVMGSEAAAAWLMSLAAAAPTAKNAKRTLLEKHLNDYTARNTFDYFIHKDLGGFLRRELDFYIKNEVMHLDDIESEGEQRVSQYLAKIKAMRRIAHKIIDFLAQLENFQKKLWLKKKFVVETNWLVTLDRVPEVLYPEIAANEAQREEWVRLFAIDEIDGDLAQPGYTVPLTVDFLKANQSLVLDTAFFDGVFRVGLLASFDDLDEQTDGLLVHSENFQALQLLRERYREQVKCVYIDPPYNTEADRSSGKFLYKDGYERSSWISLLHGRLLQITLLVEDEAPVFVSIDEHEFGRMNEILDQLLGARIGVFTWVKKAKGSHLSQTIRDMTEFVLAYSRTKTGLTLYGEAAYSDKAQPLAKKTNARKSLVFPANTVRTALADGEYESGARGSGDSAITFGQPFVVAAGVVTTRLIGEGPFVWTQAKLDQELECGTVPLLSRKFGLNVMRHDQGEKSKRPATFLTTDQGIGTNETAFQEYTDLLGIEPRDHYPKPVSLVSYLVRSRTYFSKGGLVLDAFAGTGTTGHAVINLNREDGGQRKFVLVEMADYFDTVLLPRHKKITCTPEWKNGKPMRRATDEERERGPHLIKYLRLESYEDALNNLRVQRSAAQTQLLANHPHLRQDYTLRYMLDVESAGSASLLDLDAFEEPFSYTLQIAQGSVGETRPVVVDLVETFNYLLGLRVKHVDAIRGFKVVEGASPQGERVLVIWRNSREKTNADLDEFFQKQGYNTRDTEFDVIYVNGDNNLENLRRPDETWKVRLIEDDFKRLMFDVEDV